MRVFITGVAGFLGSNLAETLLSQGHEVVGNDSLVGGDTENVPAGVEFHEVDCKDQAGMVRITKGVDVLYHCAATAHEGLSVFSPHFVTSNIFEASVATFSAAASNGVSRVVFCSSMARYGNGIPPFIEDEDPQPIDPYGISKVAAEEVLKVLGKVHGFVWNIAVPHNIIGPRQKFDDPFRNVVSIMANRNLMGKPAIIYGDGEQTRCFSHVDDCLSCLLKLGFDRNIHHEVVNIGPDEDPISINEVAVMVANETGFNGEPIYYPQGRPQEVKHAWCSSTKARQILGYETTKDTRTAVKDTVDWIRSAGPREFDYHIPLEIVNEKTPRTWTEKMI